MKIEISLEMGKEHGKDMEKKPSAFHKRVAQMLAKEKGKKKPDDMDLKKAMELDEEED